MAIRRLGSAIGAERGGGVGIRRESFDGRWEV